MKFPTSLAFITSLVALLPTVHGAPGHIALADWSITGVPSTGLTDVTFPLTIVEADHISGYYFAQMFSFAGSTSRRGYIGLQPRPNQDGNPVLHATFSNFITGSKTDDPNCHDGADGGDGTSCFVEWNGVHGRTYDLEVKYAGSGTQRWVGTVIDTVTKARVHVGSYTLPADAAGIQGSELSFVEWYLWNVDPPPSTDRCAHLPYQKTIFGTPRTTHAGSVGALSVFYGVEDCVGMVALHSENVATGVETNSGFHGQAGFVELALVGNDNVSALGGSRYPSYVQVIN
ncbi:hypothetical protein B0H14DRAFT_2849071 [Mycena olivaceomarginata]|nr:hypothetical protein B0H14DRAFT_2849071 [Mycena olivaceomarginata]